MADRSMQPHPELVIPGALPRVRVCARPATYPGGMRHEQHPPTKSALAQQPVSILKSDFIGSGLSFWQTNPTAFAAWQHLEEP